MTTPLIPVQVFHCIFCGFSGSRFQVFDHECPGKSKKVKV